MKITLITHNYPTPEQPNAGCWLKALWPDASVIHLPKIPWKFWQFVREVRSLPEDTIIIACWLFPAGLIAYLSRREYILLSAGMASIKVGHNRIWAWMFWPIVKRAQKVVATSDYLRNCLVGVYGYLALRDKARTIHLPAGWHA